jgi:hypothetical protein
MRPGSWRAPVPRVTQHSCIPVKTLGYARFDLIDVTQKIWAALTQLTIETPRHHRAADQMHRGKIGKGAEPSFDL